jgi:hypothetical protein
MQHLEPMISLATSSGTVHVSRDAQARDGFYLEAEPVEMSSETDDDLRVFRVGPFATLESALHTLARDGSWALEKPTAVHPDVRADVWDLARAVISARGGESLLVEQEWRRLCSVGGSQ